MSIRFTARTFAPDFELFAPGAFDRNIGKIVPMLLAGHIKPGRCRVVAAEIVDDGHAALITYEVVDE